MPRLASAGRDHANAVLCYDVSSQPDATTLRLLFLPSLQSPVTQSLAVKCAVYRGVRLYGLDKLHTPYARAAVLGLRMRQSKRGASCISEALLVSFKLVGATAVLLMLAIVHCACVGHATAT